MRSATKRQIAKLKDFPSPVWLCDGCRKKIDKCNDIIIFTLHNPELTNKSIEPAVEETVNNDQDLEIETSKSEDDKIDYEVEYEPLAKKACKKNVHYDDCSILKTLYLKFQHKETTQIERRNILTLAPVEWGTRKMAKFFNCSRNLCKSIRNELNEGDIRSVLSLNNQKTGRKLSKEIKNLVREFYENYDNSRYLPDITDCLSIKQPDGKRKLVQKKLILCNLKELHKAFRLQYSNLKIGFSKFCDLRPKHCVIAGATGTHSVCVCVYHQNIKLVIDGSKIPLFTKNRDIKLLDYKDLIKNIMCENPVKSCHFNTCKECKGTQVLKNELREIFDENDTDEIQYQQWRNTDRSTLVTEIISTDEFIDSLCDKVLKLKTHHFVFKQQSAYFNWKKNNLLDEEVLLQCDFSENYAFIV